MRLHLNDLPAPTQPPVAGPPTAGPPLPPDSGVKRLLRTRLDEFLELAGKAVQAAHAGIGFLSPEGTLIEHLTHGEGALGMAADPAPGVKELLAFIVQQSRPVRVADPAVVSLRPPLGPLLGVPLVRPGRFSGALYVTRLRGEAEFTPRDEEVLLAIGACLEQEQLFEQAHLLARMRLLNRVAQAAAGTLELKPVLQVALRELERHLPMNPSAVWLLDERDEKPAGDAARPADVPAAESPEIVLAATNSLCDAPGHGLAVAPGAKLALAQTPFGPCWRDGQPVYTDCGQPGDGADRRGDAATTPPEPLLTGRRALSSFAAPLRAGDRTVGILQSVCTRPTGFTSEQLQLLYLVADMLGPAISNCQLVGRLRATCEELRATRDHLIQMEKMRALGELAGGMAHDFNNALCGVLGFLELALTDKALNASTRAQLELARTSALDAAATVRRVQEFARKGHGSSVVLQPIDVNDLAREVVELTRPKWESQARAREASIAVEVRTEAACPVLGNAAELREALTNLVFNAVDAMPRGGKLRVRSWSAGSAAFLEVHDTGVGMSSAVQKRLFEPFFTTKGERGTGLGLSVTCGIVRRHGGEITVASEVGDGSAFTVRLPAAAGAARQSANGKGPPAAPATVPLRVLVVEDEQPIRVFLATVLTQFGHRPRVAVNASEAFAALDAEPFDVVLTDLGLPGVSGAEVARAVSRRSPAPPVILLTGWADQLKAEGKALEGVTQVLGKPVTLDRLSAALRAVKRRE